MAIARGDLIIGPEDYLKFLEDGGVMGPPPPSLLAPPSRTISHGGMWEAESGREGDVPPAGRRDAVKGLLCVFIRIDQTKWPESGFDQTI